MRDANCETRDAPLAERVSSNAATTRASLRTPVQLIGMITSVRIRVLQPGECEVHDPKIKLLWAFRPITTQTHDAATGF